MSSSFCVHIPTVEIRNGFVSYLGRKGFSLYYGHIDNEYVIIYNGVVPCYSIYNSALCYDTETIEEAIKIIERGRRFVCKIEDHDVFIIDGGISVGRHFVSKDKIKLIADTVLDKEDEYVLMDGDTVVKEDDKVSVLNKNSDVENKRTPVSGYSVGLKFNKYYNPNLFVLLRKRFPHA